MDTFLFAFTAIIAVAAILLHRKRNLYFKEIYKFTRCPALMTPTEHELYKSLLTTIGRTHYVFPEVHLDKLVDYRVKGTRHKGPFYHVDLKSVDFVLCDKKTLEPALVIEFDETVHTKAEIQKVDKMVEDLLSSVKIPFIRIRKSSIFDPVAVSEKIHDALISGSLG